MHSRSRSIILACTIAVSQVTTNAQAPNSWTRRPDLPGVNNALARTQSTSFTIGSRAFITCGLSNGTTSLKDLWEYDAERNLWTQRADFAGAARRSAVALEIDNRVYIGSGYTGSTYAKDLWRYDAAANTWTRVADMPAGRGGAAAFVIGTFGYVVGGYGEGNGGYQLDCWAYDANRNVWITKTGLGPQSNRRRDAIGLSLGEYGYIFSGNNNGGTAVEQQARKEYMIYNPATDQWGESSMPSDLSGGYGFVAGGVAYLGRGAELWRFSLNTGFTRMTDLGTPLGSKGFSVGSKGYVLASNGTTIKELHQFDPALNTWTRKTDLGVVGSPRHSGVGFSVLNKIYIGTGWDGYKYYGDLWQYDPITRAWAQRADFGGGLRETAVGLSIGDKGYVGTGSDVSGSRQDFWQYDPATNVWTQKANFGGSARYWAAAFSIGNKGYIGTGRDGQGNLKVDFWEYDPSTDRWTQKADFGGGARRNVSAFSIGSIGYMGMGFGGTMQKDLWAYDPASNVWTRKADMTGAPRHMATAFTAGMRGYIVGGSDGTNAIGDVWEYDPVTNAWASRAAFTGSARWAAVGATMGSTGFIITGLNAAIAYYTDLWEYTPATAACGAATAAVTITTDTKGAETSWALLRSGEGIPVCNGFGHPNSTTTTVNCCVLNGTYVLRVYDSAGDGMTTGGYMVRDANNKRLVDNLRNGGFTSLSQSSIGFTLPIGPNELTQGNCDQEGLTTNSVIQATIDPAVTTGGNTAQKGYEFLIFDPHGGFNVKVFQSIAAPGSGAPTSAPAAEKPAYLKLNAVPGLPLNKLLNVRVRRNVNGTFNEFGPACRLKVVS